MAIVYVLGAGATKAIYANAPLNDELLTLIVEKLNTNRKINVKNPYPESLSSRIGRIKQFIVEFYESPSESTSLFKQAVKFIIQGEYEKALNISQEGQFVLIDSRDIQRAVELISTFPNEYDTYQIVENLKVRRAERNIRRMRNLPRLEDILNIIEHSLGENRGLGDGWTTEKLRQVKEDLIVSIVKVIGDELKSSTNNMTIDSAVLQQFINSLDEDVVVISLNYDTAIDDLFTTLVDLPNYQIDLRYNIDDKNHSLDRYRTSTRTQLLKLHGSVNWLFCSNCNEIDVATFVHGELAEHFRNPKSNLANCPICNNAYEPIIVTPTYVKSYNNDNLRQIWRYAEQHLSQADEIIFIGFSMPDADVVLRSMFTHTLHTNRVSRSLRGRTDVYKITVVDYVDHNDDASVFRANQVKTRYERLFGDLGVDCCYITGGFAEYLERLFSQSMEHS